MPSVKDHTLARIATVNLVNMQTAASVALFTVPVGKTFFIDTVVIRNLSGSLAGGTSYGFTGWRTGINLASMTTTTVFRKLFTTDNTDFTPVAAGAVFYLVITTGSTAAVTASIDVFGHLV